MLEKYPHLASEQILDSEGTCFFNKKYNHLNDLLHYDAKVQSEVLASPASCARPCLKIRIESKFYIIQLLIKITIKCVGSQILFSFNDF